MSIHLVVVQRRGRGSPGVHGADAEAIRSVDIGGSGGSPDVATRRTVGVDPDGVPCKSGSGQGWSGSTFVVCGGNLET